MRAGAEAIPSGTIVERAAKMRAAFISIGQTPRVDLVPELGTWIGPGLEIVEFGALDALSSAEIESLAPRMDEEHLVTRLRDGSEVVVGKNAIGDRVQQILDEIDSEAFDLSVLLCTGHLPSLRARGMYLESQTLVDHGVRALSGGADLLGVILPLAEQEEQFDRRPFAGKTLRFSHASPYRLHRLEEAARELAHADVIVMHCIGYTKAQRQRVARMSGRPVLLARRLVAAAIGQLV